MKDQNKSLLSGTSNFCKKMRAKAVTAMVIGPKFIKERRKNKGALNTTEVLIGIVVVLGVTYPLYKDLISGFLANAKTWFTGQQNGIFR